MKQLSPTELDLDQVKTRTIRGLTLLVVREALIKIIAILGQLVLVRLLLPEYFGVVAVVTFLVNSVDLFTDVGLVSGVIRSKVRPSIEILSSFLVVKTALSTVAVIALWLLRPAVAGLFPALGHEHLNILTILSLTLLLRPLRTMIYGLLERDLRYDVIPFVDVSGLIIYFAVAIGLALNGFGVWSLVWAAVAKDLCEIVILEIVHPFFPRPQLSLSKISPFLKFGAPLQGNTILGVLHQSTIPLLGGMMVSPAAVGYLDWGFNMASLPRAITANVGRIAFASFSRIQDRADLLAKAIEESISIMSLVVMFLASASLFFGKESIGLILGSKWEAAAPALTWLLFAEIFLACVGVLQQAIIARGYTKELVAKSVGALIVQWMSVVTLTSVYGFVGVAVGIFTGLLLQTLFYWNLVKQAGVAVALGRALLPQLAVLLFMLPVGLALAQLPSGYLWLVTKLVIYSSIFAAVAGLLARHSLRRVYSLLRQHLFS